MRTLHVGGEAIQSSMRLEDPYALALDYTRCMMAFLLFHPEPREALMIGLGGGSLAKFFFKYLRKELPFASSSSIVAWSRRRASISRCRADGERFRVEIGDGAEALAPECCDVLMVDAFEDELHVPRLASGEFYDGVFLALTEPGALVVNFMNDDPKLDLTLQRLERAFGGAVICMPALYDPNILAFAFKGISSSLSWNALRARAAQLESQLKLPFTRYVSRLRAMNRWTAAELIIAP